MELNGKNCFPFGNWELWIAYLLTLLVCICFCLQRLFVAQTDNVDVSSCIITPPQVKYDFFSPLILVKWNYCASILTSFCCFNCSFLLNGRGVDKRTNVNMVGVDLVLEFFLFVVTLSTMGAHSNTNHLVLFLVLGNCTAGSNGCDTDA